MPDELEPKPVKERATFQLIKTARLDKKGRFYLPESVVANAFEGIKEEDREVDVYIGPGGRILLIPVKD